MTDCLSVIDILDSVVHIAADVPEALSGSATWHRSLIMHAVEDAMLVKTQALGIIPAALPCHAFVCGFAVQRASETSSLPFEKVAGFSFFGPRIQGL